jgi:hypothetical protein
MFDVKYLPGFSMDGPYTSAGKEKLSWLITHGKEFTTTIDVGPDLANDDAFWNSLDDRLWTLLFNHVKFENKIYTSRQDILDFINNHFPRLTPQDKQLAVLEWIHSQTKFDGDSIDLDRRAIIDENVWRKLFLNHPEEIVFYLNTMKDDYVEYEMSSGYYERIHLTIKGLGKMVEFLQSKNSNICFVAMSFDPALNSIYDQGIEPAIIECGFKPVIVRKENIDASETINDAIIANIKKAHFSIVDFTFQKPNVYFEAGYALGRGQKVIYICREDDIKNAGFDTRNYQHILWKESQDLKKSLVDRIEAYIKN